MLLKRGKVWHTRLMFDGQLYQKSLHTRIESEAVKLESAFRSSLVRGEFGILDAARAPVLHKFEERLLPHLKSSVAPRTYGFYKENLKVLNRFVPLATSRLHKIDASLVEKFVQHRLAEGVSIVTVNHSLRTLRRVLHIAQEWKLIRDVPRIKMLPGENQREYVIDDATLTLMVQHIKAKHPLSVMQYLLPFLVDTGLRISEACNLQKKDVTLSPKPGAILVTKGKSKYARREIPLTERASAAITAAMEQSHSASAFSAKGGRRALTRHYPSEEFRELRRVLNLGPQCVLHSTRHTFCTRLGNAGADAFTIQRLAGHSSIVISQRYVHSDREGRESAIRLLDGLNNAKAGAENRT
jgi:site-specific recombinase XerD